MNKHYPVEQRERAVKMVLDHLDEYRSVYAACQVIVALAPGNLVALVVNAQVLNGIITPMLLTYVLILANRSTVLGTAKNGPIFRIVATMCVSVVGLLAFVVLVETVFGLD